MSRWPQDLLSLFVMPPAEQTDPAIGAVDAPRRPAGPPIGGRGPRGSRASGSGRRADAPSLTPAVVVGGARSAAFAVDLSVNYAARSALRCAVTAVWGTTPPAPPRGPATRLAERIGTDLSNADCDKPAAGGRGVVLRLDDDPVAAVRTVRRLQGVVADQAALVLAVCGPRAAAFDPLLADARLIVLALGGDAPAGLDDIAKKGLAQTSPEARIVAVSLDEGVALPRPLRHRAAIRRSVGMAT